MEKSKVLPKVFMWMFIGLLITFGTGYFISTNSNMLSVANDFYIVFALLQIGIVFYLASRITKMSATSAQTWFLIYSFVTGITFGFIFAAFNLGTIMFVFLIAAAVFGIFALFGYFTKMNLSKMGSYLGMGLLAVILCLFLNIFMQNSSFDLIITIISLIIFIGFTAYDIKKIIALEEQGFPEENLAIYGALELYLDFINLFLNLLKLIARNRD